MMTTAELHEVGRLASQAGDLARAEQVYRQLLQRQPADARVWYFLAALCQVQGRLTEAIEYFQQALRLAPQFAEAEHDLAIAYLLAHQPTLAEPHLRRALELKPDFANAHNNLGIFLTEQGKLEEALSHFRESVRLQPESPDFHRGLGSVLRNLGRLDEAASSYRRAVELRPGFAEAHLGLASVLSDRRCFPEAACSCRRALQIRPNYAEANNSLGIALLGERKAREAVDSFREALRLRPDYPEALINLGQALGDLGELDEALRLLRRALQLRPASAVALSNLGFLCMHLGDLEQAVLHCREAVRLQAGDADAHTRLGLVHAERGELAEALACYERALALQPSHTHAHKNRSLVWLLQGEYERGWIEYEWRWKTGEQPARVLGRPAWDGSPLAGRTLLLHVEQGLGDTLQFVRYAALARQQGGRVVLVCQKALVRLLKGCPGIDGVMAEGEPLPEFDVHAPLLSLPRLLGTTLATVPANVPYLSAKAELLELWRRELSRQPGLKIGMAWQGSKSYRRDWRRSVPLIEFAPLAEVEGVQLVSLQKGPGSEQLSSWTAARPITDLGARLDEEAGPFMDTAAVMKNLDLVVSPDTAIAHLAGGLGVPTWVLLPTVPHWPWLLGREDSPWYPTVRLFRQEQEGHWGPVFACMAQALRLQVSAEPGL
jgi:tetratricopeptide (TPR) repeat protein